MKNLSAFLRAMKAVQKKTHTLEYDWDGNEGHCETTLTCSYGSLAVEFDVIVNVSAKTYAGTYDNPVEIDIESAFMDIISIAVYETEKRVDYQFTDDQICQLEESFIKSVIF